MVTTVVDQLRMWQATGGPALWNRAWDRTLRVVAVPLADYAIVLDGVVVAEGAAGLTTAFYVLAAEAGVEPEAVTAQHVEALYGAGTTAEERRAAWEVRLTALGHDLTDTSDPVVFLWSQIAHDHRTPPGDYDDTLDYTLTRWGPGYTTGMDQLRSRFGITL